MKNLICVLPLALLCSCSSPRWTLEKLIIPVEHMPPRLSMPMIKPSGIPHMRYVSYNPQIFTGRENLEEVAHTLMTPHVDRETITGALISNYRSTQDLEVYGLVFTTPSACEAARKHLSPELQPSENVKVITRENRMAIIKTAGGAKRDDASFEALIQFVNGKL